MKIGHIAAACLSLALSAGAFAQTAMKISISTAQNSHQGVAIDTFAKEVAARTNGRYKVETFYNGSLGGERESIEAVQLGTQSNWPSRRPARCPTSCPRPRSSTCPSCSATRRTHAPCSTAPSARICSPSSMPRASRRWRGPKTASAT